MPTKKRKSLPPVVGTGGKRRGPTPARTSDILPRFGGPRFGGRHLLGPFHTLSRAGSKPSNAVERCRAAVELVAKDDDEMAGHRLAGCGQTACRTSWMRCRERGSRENRSVLGGQRPRMDFGHGLPAGCGQTACRTSWMRCRERSSRENRRFSSGQRPGMDFGHGLLVLLR
jgi:hypothetical protein